MATILNGRRSSDRNNVFPRVARVYPPTSVWPSNMARWLFVLAVLTCAVNRVTAHTVIIDLNTALPAQYLDRWMYPFNVTPGSRIQAPLFAAINSPTFDDRDGQFVFAVDTTNWGVPSGLLPSNYRIDSLRVTVRESVGGYVFDPTYDSYRTYLDPATSQYETDGDSGRPVELFGVELRNGYERFGWPDGSTSTEAPVFSSGSPFGPADRGTRHVFAADAQGRDISNNIDSIHEGAAGFEVDYFAVGQVIANDQDLPAGGIVPANAEIRFDVLVADAKIQAYLQQSLADGQLGLALSSLHATPQFGGSPIPNIATANHFAISGPIISLDYTILPDVLLGDLDLDRDVDSNDLLLFISNWTGADLRDPPRLPQEGDLDSDQDVDSADMLHFLGAWTGALSAGRPSTDVTSHSAMPGMSVSVSVPEPEPRYFMLVGGLVLAWWSPWRRQRTNFAAAIHHSI